MHIEILEGIPKKTQNLEFCQSQRSRFDPLEAAPIQMDRSDAEEVKDGDADTGKNQVLSFLGYRGSFPVELIPHVPKVFRDHRRRLQRSSQRKEKMR